MSLILSIGTANPQYCHRQEEILGFMQQACVADDITGSKLRAVYRKSDIETRYSTMPDYSPGNGRSFYPSTDNLEPFPGLTARMRHFYENALPLSVKAIGSCFEKSPDISSGDITHLITVTCTGLSAPGLDIGIARHFGLNRNLQRTSVNFMGCYAAIHALKLADMICKTEKDPKVLIVCTELCTLHFQRMAEDDHLVANSLFADGSAAVLVVPANGQETGLRMRGFYSEIEDSGFDHMAWEVSETGFLMTLSSYVPKVIESTIAGLFHRAALRYGICRQDVGHWAIHPGGKRILEIAACELSLGPEEIKPSAEVLRKYGNMSSPTVLFVLEEIGKKAGKGENIFGVAFGPGLTMETMLLTRE
jgi:predicted naringenin-chalcone synthase